MVNTTAARSAAGRWLMALVAGFGFWSAALVAAAPSTAPATAPPPRSIDDLRRVEERVQAVLATAMPATVGISGGGGQGSGVIVSEDGLVLTAGHVAKEAGRTVSILFANGKRARGKTLGINHSIDSGMVRITDPGPWPFVPMAPADAIARGQWCVALGHPGGFRPDRPPVLRLGRILELRSTSILTNCTLVGGDSGGPLFDLEGRVIGIHSRIGTSTSHNVHVPIATFHDTWKRLAAGEVWGTPRTRKPTVMLGIMAADDREGVRIQSVIPKSPAEEAGLKPDDVIARIDDKPVAGRDALFATLDRHKPGDEVRLAVLRGGRKLDITVTLIEKP